MIFLFFRWCLYSFVG